MESSDEEEDDMLTIKRKDHEIQDDDGKIINRSSRRIRGMVSNPLFKIIDFFCIFPMNFTMATLGLKEIGKLHWEGRESKRSALLAFSV